MRVFLIILGVLMLLPGACGVLVMGVAIFEGDPGSIIAFALPCILIGVIGIALIRKQMNRTNEAPPVNGDEGDGTLDT